MYLRIDRALVLFTWSIQTFWQINCHLPRQSPGPSSGKKLSTISSLTKHSYNRENHLNANEPSPSNRGKQKAAINISKALNPEVTMLKESFWQVLEMPVVSEAPGQPTPHLIYSTSVFCRAPNCGYQLVTYFINSPKMPFLGWDKYINIVHSWKRSIDFNYGKADRVTCIPGFNDSCQQSNDFKDKLGGTSSRAKMEDLQHLQFSVAGSDLKSARVRVCLGQCFYESIWGRKNQLLRQKISNLEWRITS